MCDPQSLRAPRPETEAACDAAWCSVAAPVAVVAALAGLLLVAGALVATGPLPAVAMLWAAVAPVDLVAFAAATVVLRRRHPPGLRARALELVPWPDDVRALLARTARALLLLWPAAVVLTLASVSLLSLTGHEAGPSEFVEMMLREGGAPFWVSSALVTLLVAPFAEEILFRLVLFESLRDLGNAGALCLTSAAFALVHQIPEQIPALFLLGVVLQEARRRSGGLWLPLAIHAGFNAVSIVVLLIWRLLA